MTAGILSLKRVNLTQLSGSGGTSPVSRSGYRTVTGHTESLRTGLKTTGYHQVITIVMKKNESAAWRDEEEDGDEDDGGVDEEDGGEDGDGGG